MIFLFSYIPIGRLFPDSPEGGKEPVDMRPDEEEVEAEIKPQHYDDDCGKTAVHIEAVKMLDVNGKAPGENTPGGRGKHGAGNLMGKFQLTVGYIGIHRRKYQYHNTPGKKPPEMQQQREEILHLGHMPHNGVRQQITEYHYNQQKYDGNQKNDQVKGGYNSLQHIVPVLHHAVHGIQSPHQRQHALPRRPDRHNSRSAHDTKGIVIDARNQRGQQGRNRRWQKQDGPCQIGFLQRCIRNDGANQHNHGDQGQKKEKSGAGRIGIHICTGHLSSKPSQNPVNSH